MRRYWRARDAQECETARTFRQLADVALRIIGRMSQNGKLPVGQVCGPITSGGTGNKQRNLEIFQETINRLNRRKKCVFNQLPFEPALRRITHQSGEPESNLLTGFYLPIFESGLIKTLYFMHGWESSQGAVWEHNQALRLNLKIVYLNPDLTLI